MKKRLNTGFFSLCFIAALIAEAYCFTALEGDLFSVMGIGLVVLITGYLLIDSLGGKLKQGIENIKFYIDSMYREEAEKYSERYTELMNIQKATYSASKKSSFMLEEQIKELQNRLELIEESNIKALQRIAELQKKSLEGQKNAINLEINYNKQNTLQIMKALQEEAGRIDNREQLIKILEVLQGNHELLKSFEENLEVISNKNSIYSETDKVTQDISFYSETDGATEDISAYPETDKDTEDTSAYSEIDKDTWDTSPYLEAEEKTWGPNSYINAEVNSEYNLTYFESDVNPEDDLVYLESDVTPEDELAYLEADENSEDDLKVLESDVNLEDDLVYLESDVNPADDLAYLEADVNSEVNLKVLESDVNPEDDLVYLKSDVTPEDDLAYLEADVNSEDDLKVLESDVNPEDDLVYLETNENHPSDPESEDDGRSANFSEIKIMQTPYDTSEKEDSEDDISIPNINDTEAYIDLENLSVEAEEEITEAVKPTVVPLYSDPNKKLSPEEIAALFASFGQ